MNVLITGGLGFIGSNLFNFMREKNPDYKLVILDSCTYAADENNINDCESKRIIKFSITDRRRLFSLFENYKFTHVIHLAAESHVDNSIENPMEFINTNVIGTANLLDASVKHNVKLFYHISTDEVFGQLGETGSFNENTPYDPRSPYSASKAASDHLVRAYYHTYKLPVVISNCSNNYGPNQHIEKLIPKVIKNILDGKQIPIYGDGSNVRDWLYVTDHVEAIDLIVNNGRIGETYCIGGDNETTNLEITKLICKKVDEVMMWDKKSEDLITFVEDRKGHDFRYSIDYTKINNELGWKPKVGITEGIEKTINYYLKKFVK